MARVILSQYIALMEMYQAQLQKSLDLLKEISEFEDFDEFKYQQILTYKVLKSSISDGLLFNMVDGTEDAIKAFREAVVEKEEVKK